MIPKRYSPRGRNNGLNPLESGTDRKAGMKEVLLFWIRDLKALKVFLQGFFVLERGYEAEQDRRGIKGYQER